MKVAIIGAGISGLTIQWLLKEIDSAIKIDLFEERLKIGGNCSDVLIKRFYKQDFGPHIFHTNKKYIWNFLNQFSKFNSYNHKVLSYVNDKYNNFPILYSEIPEKIKNSLNFKLYLENKFDFSNYKNAQEYLYNILGKKYSDLFFKKYSEKQWGIKFSELPVEIVRRIPIKLDDNTSYFPNDIFQGIPENGFQYLFTEMLKINYIEGKVKYKELQNKYDFIFLTGSPDEFFKYSEGNLKYRYINFIYNIYSAQYQKNSVINFPNLFNYTRTTEFNHFLPEKTFDQSCVCFEYPTNNYSDTKCYPIFWDKESINNLEKYKNIDSKVIFLGRLAEFKYMNMDVAIHNVFEKLKKIFPKEVSNIILRLENAK